VLQQPVGPAQAVLVGFAEQNATTQAARASSWDEQLESTEQASTELPQLRSASRWLVHPAVTAIESELEQHWPQFVIDVQLRDWASSHTDVQSPAAVSLVQPGAAAAAATISTNKTANPWIVRIATLPVLGTWYTMAGHAARLPGARAGAGVRVRVEPHQA